VTTWPRATVSGYSPIPPRVTTWPRATASGYSPIPHVTTWPTATMGFPAKASPAAYYTALEFRV
jgi:hypothetical protein